MVIPVELLSLPSIEITEILLREGNELIIRAKSTNKDNPCRICNKPCSAHGYGRSIELRHLPVLGYKTYIQMTPRRGICKSCATPTTTTETLSWYGENTRYTKPYEAYLLFTLINSTLKDTSRKEDVDYQSIEAILDNYIETDVNFKLINKLCVLGIDEISLRKGRQRYVTVITYRQNKQVKILKVLEGRCKQKVKEFFQSIPVHLKMTITAVCSDLYDGYINAAKEVFGDKVIVADRFHVAKLYRKKLISVRKSELKHLKKDLVEDEYKALKEATSILRRGRDFFTEEEQVKLAKLFELSPKLKLAYKYSQSLTAIFNSDSTKEEAESAFREWITEVSQSDVICFKNFSSTLDKYMNEITNYFVSRNNSGFVEGFNNKIKVLTRRCYGLKKINSLFQRIKLDTEGLDIFKFAGAQNFA